MYIPANFKDRLGSYKVFDDRDVCQLTYQTFISSNHTTTLQVSHWYLPKFTRNSIVHNNKFINTNFQVLPSPLLLLLIIQYKLQAIGNCFICYFFLLLFSYFISTSCDQLSHSFRSFRALHFISVESYEETSNKLQSLHRVYQHHFSKTFLNSPCLETQFSFSFCLCLPNFSLDKLFAYSLSKYEGNRSINI